MLSENSSNNLSHSILHWSQRPNAVKRSISYAYASICDHTRSKWGLHNGYDSYDLNGIYDSIILEKIILNGLARGETQFCFMDIGAGNFSWGKEVVKWINQNPLFKNSSIQITVVGLRGETHVNKIGVRDGMCTIYEYGNFRIENLSDELKKHHFPMREKIDFIVSSWCFRHLADPTGTLLQAYLELKPETGIIFFDGFLLQLDDQKSHTGNMLDLITNFDTPFIFYTDNSNHRIHAFAMKRSRIFPKLSVQYKGMITYEFDNGSKTLVVFETNASWKKCQGDYKTIRTYGTHHVFSADSEIFKNWLLYDHNVVIEARVKKIYELFTDAENDLCADEILKEIYRLCFGRFALESMVKLDPDNLLKVIERLNDINPTRLGQMVSGLERCQAAVLNVINAYPFPTRLFIALVKLTNPDVLKQDDVKKELIFLLIRDKHVEAVSALLEAGMDLNVVSSRGETPIEFAVRSQCKEMLDLLKSHQRFEPPLVTFSYNPSDPDEENKKNENSSSKFVFS